MVRHRSLTLRSSRVRTRSRLPPHSVGSVLNSNQAIVTWGFGAHTTSVSINQSPTGGTSGQMTTLIASFLDISANPPLPLLDETINFSVDGANCSGSTNYLGIASCQVTLGSPGISTLSATFSGDSTAPGYLASHASRGFNVIAAPASPSVTSTPTLSPSARTASPTPSSDGDTYSDGDAFSDSIAKPTRPPLQPRLRLIPQLQPPPTPLLRVPLQPEPRLRPRLDQRLPRRRGLRLRRSPKRRLRLQAGLRRRPQPSRGPPLPLRVPRQSARSVHHPDATGIRFR